MRWFRIGVVALAYCLLMGLVHAPAQNSVRADEPQYGDDRFGVTLDGDIQQLAALGTRWFITYGEDPPPQVLPGSIWVPYVSFQHALAQPEALAARAAAHPGSYWLMSNEPNVPQTDNTMSGDQYARALHDLVATIKKADPSAHIVGPNIINFDFTCILCPGYTSGHDWMDDFLAAYQADYGTLPPIDVWAIHTYPLDFEHFPQANAPLMEDQLLEFRAYLDATPGLSGAPIWDTEIGTHWGYEGLDWRDDGTGNYLAYPVGQYRTDLLLSYMQELLGWLSQNGPALHIDRWFFFATSVSYLEPWESIYGGISLLSGPGRDATLTPFGELYRELAGLGPRPTPLPSGR